MTAYTAPGLIISTETEPARRIVEAVLRVCNVSEKDVKSNKRYRNMVYARQLIAYFLRKKTPMSYLGIGRLLGNRDHSTILHSVSKIETLMEVYPDIVADVNKINFLIAKY